MTGRWTSALLGALLLVQPVAAQQVPISDFRTEIVVNAQDALTRLGYDIGASDGQWGKRSREALNTLRAENGLPPAKDLTGSSIALLHRLSPGPMTLPHPGMLVGDPVARRSWLMDEANKDVARAQCPARVGDGVPIDSIPPVEVIQTIDTKGNAVLQTDDWFSRLLEGFVAADDRCLTGKDDDCRAIVDTIGKWADADAIRIDRPFDVGNAAEIPRWIGNILLRKMMASYMVARPFAKPDALREASILDWFKRRIDTNYFILEDPKKPSDVESSLRQNHAIAATQLPMLFGILSGDRSMLQPALDLRKIVLGALREDGSIPAEARRGGRWFHYGGVGLGQLIAVGEWAAAQGIDVYADDTNERYTVQHGVKFLLDGLEDFDVAIPYAKANFAAGESSFYQVPNVSGWMFGWIPAYRERFGNDANMRRLATQTVDADMCSKDAVNDGEKLRDLKFCLVKPNESLMLADLILTQRPEPSHHMAYSAGCMQGTLTWNELVGKQPAAK